MRLSNIQMVLTILEQFHPISRTEIVSMTELSPASVTRIINALMGLGLICEAESVGAGQRGRKAVNLSIRPDGLYVAGVSVEADSLRLCLMDFGGEVVGSLSAPLNASRRYTEDEIACAAFELYQRLPSGLIADWSRVRAVGVGVAGITDPKRGVILQSDQMGWSKVDLGGALARSFHMPVWIENDVKACLTGERARRGMEDIEHMAYLLVGSGVGLAAVSNGQLIRGENNAAGEIEHMPLGPGIQGPDTLERHLIEAEIVKRAQAVDPSIRLVESIVTAYRQQMDWAVLLINDFIRYLKLTLALINGLLNPRHIILGGSIIPKLSDLLKDVTEDGQVLIGEDYGDALMTGAAICALRHATQELVTGQIPNEPGRAL
jgi:predicted NBD/HSP70 family sugar kinase